MRVSSVKNESADAVRIGLVTVDGSELRFKSGQYLSLCFSIDGQDVRRPYSVCSAAHTGRIEICCKRVSEGLVSNYLCDQLCVGDELEVRGPSGRFCLQDDVSPMLFIAAGSGITPMMGLLGDALHRNPQRSIRLLFANRNSDSILFATDLKDLQSRHRNFEVVHVLSQPEAGWTGASGRLSGQDVVRQYLPGPAACVYLCGPMAMMEDLQAQLLLGGHAQQRILSEAFTPAARATQARPTMAQAIEFRKSGCTIEQAPGQSILDAALFNGVALEFSCTVGGCAACKVRVLEGAVQIDEPHCLSDAEQEQGFTLACSAYATQAVVLDA
ncbi:MAG: 2Fe-2S iron-sulfur cluster-binding protein [Oceanococcus sp.]